MSTCADCSSTWTGPRACHCCACHRTFGGEHAFTLHQGATEGCADPADIKRQNGENVLSLNPKGHWVQRAPDKARFGVANGAERQPEVEA